MYMYVNICICSVCMSGIMWRWAAVVHRMWKILSNHTTRSWSIQATIMHSHATAEKRRLSTGGEMQNWKHDL